MGEAFARHDRTHTQKRHPSGAARPLAILNAELGHKVHRLGKPLLLRGERIPRAYGWLLATALSLLCWWAFWTGLTAMLGAF